MAELKENYDYAAINRRINKSYDPLLFKDLRGIQNIIADYDASLSPTDNIQKFLREKIYEGDAEKAKHHSYDIFHAIHEQTQVRGITSGFNDFANALRAQRKPPIMVAQRT